jgi:hypothetical protein
VSTHEPPNHEHCGIFSQMLDKIFGDRRGCGYFGRRRSKGFCRTLCKADVDVRQSITNHIDRLHCHSDSFSANRCNSCLTNTQFSLQVGFRIGVTFTSYCDQDLIAAFLTSRIESNLSIEVYEIICTCSCFNLDDRGVSRANVRIIEDRKKFPLIRSITVRLLLASTV